MAQHGTHVVHLSMARTGIATREVDFLHDHRGLRQAQTRAAVFGGDECGQPACLGERFYKCLRVSALFVNALPIGAVKSRTQLAQGIAYVLVFVCRWQVVCHGVAACVDQWATACMHTWPWWS